MAIWSVLEPSLGIIAGCMATLRPLLKCVNIGRTTKLGTSYCKDYTSKIMAPITAGRQLSRHSQFKKLANDSLGPIEENVELTSQAPASRRGSRSSDRTILRDSLDRGTENDAAFHAISSVVAIPQPSYQPNTMSSRDSWVE